MEKCISYEKAALFTKNDTLLVKGVAIILLLFHHLFLTEDLVIAYDLKFMLLSGSMIQILAIMARICVWIFVFLSAYGLTIQYESWKKGNVHFVIDKWLSLISSFWLPFMFVFISYGILVQDPMSLYINIPNAVFDFLGISDFFHTPTLTGSWWYMCFAQVLILLIPFCYYICKKWGWYTYLIIFLSLQYLSGGLLSSYGGLYSQYYLTIVLGVLCAQSRTFEVILKRPKSRIEKMVQIVIEVLLISGGLLLKYTIMNNDNWQISSVLSSVIVFNLCLLMREYFQIDILKKCLVFLGKHSGNMFMIHHFLYTFIPQWIFWSKNAVISFLCLLFFSLLISIIIEMVKSVIRYDYGIKKLRLIINGCIDR
ncbi:acyltransferase family protein [Hominifimenecus sp. rT4P-3]|uniref:acyltransferase family protein n=1 Tax=Hominifimenecus sp. rT4P-3 TaxID=3242979 RepID=UPI003DA297A8